MPLRYINLVIGKGDYLGHISIRRRQKLWFPGHSAGQKDVFLHPYRGSKLEGPPFEGPQNSVQEPRGVGGAPSHRHKEGRWMGRALAPLTSVIVYNHTTSIHRWQTPFLIKTNLRAPSLTVGKFPAPRRCLPMWKTHHLFLGPFETKKPDGDQPKNKSVFTYSRPVELGWPEGINVGRNGKAFSIQSQRSFISCPIAYLNMSACRLKAGKR